jgi:hypothetical protein
VEKVVAIASKFVVHPALSWVEIQSTASKQHSRFEVFDVAIAVLRVTTFSTFVSENSALRAKLIVAARSQGSVRLKLGLDE